MTPPDAVSTPPWAPGELRVLVVDDEPDVRLGLKILAESLGADTRDAAGGEAAIAEIEKRVPHVIVSDISLGGLSGLDLLDEVKRLHPEVLVVLVTGFGTIDMAVSAMHRGAAHFITKPFDNEEILDAIRRFGRQAIINERVRALSRKSDADADRPTLIARSPRMTAVLQLVEQVAPTPMSVLIEGESGVGKELVAKAIHGRGSYPDRPFLAVNTAALPDSLLESELFGHRKGAFTGADRDRHGIFEEARGGTVFLDEIALMSPSFQGKLLRVLQERTVVPLGTTQAVNVDFRLVAATSRSLREQIEQGAFREDLYYRLRVVQITVPPLRERREDIAPLAAHFLSKYARFVPTRSGEPPVISYAVLDALESHDWPGNVRELENSIQRALVLSGGAPITVEHLDEEPTTVRLDPTLPYEEGKAKAVREFQRRFVERALRNANGNVTHAAQNCGLTRAALQRILKSLGLDRRKFTDV